MKGDFTRDTFDASKHFSRVLMQQGRVQLDADWNEQAAILLHYLQTLAADLIGPYGGPTQADGFTPGDGFAITPLTNKQNDFGILAGRYYVDGILCENDRADCTYFAQPDYPLAGSSLDNKIYLVYLDVWEQHITPLEDDRIREVALGGPDTATRAKVVWQVNVTDKQLDGTDFAAAIPCDQIRQQWPDWVNTWQAQSACQLNVRLEPGQENTDPCTIEPTSAYRGRENQLYRVEIHVGGSLKKNDKPTFKWSRDNGSIAAAWLGNNDDGGLLVSNARGFIAGQWIEITSEAQDLLGQPGDLVKITRVEGDALYLESPQTWDKDTPKKVRRWDQTQTENIQLVNGAVPITEGTTDADWIDLEDGLQVQFQPNGNYRTGDYWLIPARTTGAIEWPSELDSNGQVKLDPEGNPVPAAQSPHGIVHHYAPLWFISVNNGTIAADASNDLRGVITPMGKCLIL